MAIVDISWTENPPTDQVTKYQVYQDDVKVAEPTTNTASIPDVPPGVHKYEVSAVNAWGEGPKSDPVSTPPAAGKPGGVVVTVTVTVSVT